MPYCTETDVKLAIPEADLVQLTDDSDAGVVDSDVVTRAIADADAEIDSYIGVKHGLPLASTPAIIRRISVDIAIHNLYQRRQGPPEFRAKKYENAIAILWKIASGDLKIGTSDDKNVAVPGLLSSSPSRVFSRDDLDGY